MNKISFIGLTILLSAFLTFAQTTTGRLLGTVNGPDGVLPNATITAKDTTTAKEFTVSSKDDGSFLFPQLEFGTYSVTISANGFKTYIANEVKIDVGREYSLSPTLEIGSIQESVTVTAGADVVTATTSQISNTISPQQILALPLLERNPLNLITLQAGTSSNSFQNTSINGLRTSLTNITRDGINIQDAFIRTNATDFAPGRPSVDDTGEFTIALSNQEADQGGGGAQIRLVTRAAQKIFTADCLLTTGIPISRRIISLTIVPASSDRSATAISLAEN
ncbi:MAG: carboxypeptidase regulatory-like domain-containing protein [Blastocatellia bacterium]|nr:carboxypeptidase regulatory-like domain-containing protein [Blastocatellia bacterium]